MSFPQAFPTCKYALLIELGLRGSRSSSVTLKAENSSPVFPVPGAHIEAAQLTEEWILLSSFFRSLLVLTEPVL